MKLPVPPWTPFPSNSSPTVSLDKQVQGMSSMGGVTEQSKDSSMPWVDLSGSPRQMNEGLVSLKRLAP
jgi:hypothetical protein